MTVRLLTPMLPSTWLQTIQQVTTPESQHIWDRETSVMLLQWPTKSFA